MNNRWKMGLALGALSLSAQAMAQITLYEHDGWRGRAMTASGPVQNLARSGFNDLASSAVVDRGRWEVCDGVGFQGNCRVLRRGSYESLGGMGLNDRISSVRPAARREGYGNEAPEPLPQATYEYRRRPNEPVFQAQVTSTRAVFGESGQRCWMERQQVPEPRRDTDVGRAIVGALIGGVLGHQVGGGTGRDLATAGGALAGAAIASRTGEGRDGNYGAYPGEVRRCENLPDRTPDYWEVSYVFRGIEHRIQMSAPPGPTIYVNRRGEPRQ